MRTDWRSATTALAVSTCHDQQCGHRCTTISHNAVPPRMWDQRCPSALAMGGAAPFAAAAHPPLAMGMHHLRPPTSTVVVLCDARRPERSRPLVLMGTLEHASCHNILVGAGQPGGRPLGRLRRRGRDRQPLVGRSLRLPGWVSRSPTSSGPGTTATLRTSLRPTTRRFRSSSNSSSSWAPDRSRHHHQPPARTDR